MEQDETPKKDPEEESKENRPSEDSFDSNFDSGRGQVNESEKLEASYSDVESTPEPVKEIQSDRSTRWDQPLFIFMEKPDIFDQKYFERIGFNAAIGKNGVPEENLANAVSNHLQQKEDKINRWKSIYSLRKQESEDKIKFFGEEITVLKEKKQQFLDDRKETEESYVEVKEKAEQLRKELIELYKKFGSSKKDLVKGRIDEMFNELDDLVIRYDTLSQRKYEINKKTFADNKEALNIKVNFFKKFEKIYERTYEKLNDKIYLLTNTGIGDYSSRVLIGVGLTAALVTGWFFSIYTMESNLNSDSVLFFILRGIFDFSSSVIAIFPNEVLGALMLFLGLLTILGLISGIIVLSQRIINREEGNKKVFDSKLNIDLNSDNNLLFSTNLESRSMVTIWFSILPYLIFIVALYIILAVGQAINDGDQLSKLDNSLSGHFAGTTIALVIGALAYLYLGKIIEPRISRRSEDGEVKLFWLNVELGVVLIFFIVTIIALIVFSEKPIETGGGKGLFTLVQFGVLTFITAFALGYGWYYRAVLSEQFYLERKLKNLSDAIKQNIRPFPLFLTQAEQSKFNSQYLRLMEQIMQLMQLRNRITFDSMNTEKELNKPEPVETVKPKRQRRGWFRNLINIVVKEKEKEKKEEEEKLPELNDSEEKLFPDIAYEIEQTRIAYFEQKKIRDHLQHKLEQIKEEKYEYIVELQNKIDKSYRSLWSYVGQLKKYLRDLDKAISGLEIQSKKEMAQIEHGYNVGIWWLHSNLNPNNEKK